MLARFAASFLVVSAFASLGSAAGAQSTTPAPAPSRKPAFTSDATAPVALPAVFDGRVLLAGSINGHPLWFHLDSGASTFQLGAQDAKAAGVDAGPNSYAAPLDLRIGALHAPRARFYIAHYGFDVDGRHVAGIFGAPLFFSYVVTVDYGRKTVTAYPPGTFDPAATGVEPTPILIEGRESYVDACFGSTCGTFLMDTGSSMTHLSKRFVDRLGHLEPSGSARSFGYRYQGEESPVYVAPELTVGGATFRNLRVLGRQDDDPTLKDGIIGRDVWQSFAITFDWPHDRVYLVPEAQP